MNAYDGLRDSLAAAFAQTAVRLTEYIPSVLAAAVLLLAGWVIARVLRGVAVRGLGILDLLLHRVSRERGVNAPALPSASVQVVGSILFWIVILFFAAAATQVLGIAVFAAWLKDLVGYLPTLAAGALIIVAGVLLSGLARDVTIAALPALPERQRLLLGRIVQSLLLVAAVVVGADQIGIRVTFLVILAAVVAGAAIGGIALAVSFGARAFIGNLIGAHYLRQAFGIGQRVRVAGYEGNIVDLTAVSLVLETDEGRVTLPGKVFNEEPIMLVVPKTDG